MARPSVTRKGNEFAKTSFLDQGEVEGDIETNTTTTTAESTLRGSSAGPLENHTYDEFDYDPSASSEALNEDIRRMAQALAPQMSELEDVLKDFSETEKADSYDLALMAKSVTRSIMEEEDDSLDDEIHQLAMSEEALREELEFAAGMSLLGSPINGVGDDGYRPDYDLPSPVVLNLSPERLLDTSAISTPPPQAYTLQDHADYLQLQTEQVGGWYFCDMTSKLLPASAGLGVATDLIKDYCLPVPFRKLKRLYSGLVFHDNVLHDRTSGGASMTTPSRSTSATAPGMTPSLPNPQTPGGASIIPVTPSTPSTGTIPIPATPLSPLTPHGRPTTNLSTSAEPKNTNNMSILNVEEPLPVRTVAIRVRPDVLCGAIMDAAHHAFELLPNTCTTHISKRQGGHLRAAVYVPNLKVAYVVDMQLCTQKNDTLERRLLVRFYHIQDDPEALHELGQTLQRRQQQQQHESAPASLGFSEYSYGESIRGENNVMEQEKLAANNHLKQACSLIQRLMAAQQQGGVQRMDPKQQSSWLGLKDHRAFESKGAMQAAIGYHLESNFKSCPSVREENKKATPTIRRLTLPSLSAKDWPMLDVSWTLTSHVIEELDTRDCTFNTLATLPFGKFPSLPTLDVQYCSQLRRLSRENMITHLLKSAKELEDYSASAEYNCAVCITLLEPMLEYYGIPPISIPTPKSLDHYPLEYAPPQLSCPPWGSLVMEALNQVAAKTPTSEIDLTEAVQLVYHAFMKQDDEEQGARLGRKNAQIMERLAMMQSLQRNFIHNIRDSHVYSQLASKSASTFLKRSQQASNSGKEGFPSVLHPEVPLLDFKISLGASQSGRCCVTPTQILFATSYIPLFGSTNSVLFDLNEVDLEVIENPVSSLLNPFPNTMNVVLKSSREVVYSFRPAIGPVRLHTFVAIIQNFASEVTPSEYSQVHDTSQVSEDDEGVMNLIETQSEDQLSI